MNYELRIMSFKNSYRVQSYDFFCKYANFGVSLQHILVENKKYGNYTHVDIVTKNNSTFHFFLQSFAETWLTNHKAISVLLNKCSVHFSRSIVSDSLWSHEPQHTRSPCPSPLLESTQTHVHWVGEYHPTISASVVPFSCNQSFPASGSFPVS